MSFNIPPNVLCVPVMEYLVNKVNGEVMEANGDIEIIYKNGIVYSQKMQELLTYNKNKLRSFGTNWRDRRNEDNILEKVKEHFL